MFVKLQIFIILILLNNLYAKNLKENISFKYAKTKNILDKKTKYNIINSLMPKNIKNFIDNNFIFKNKIIIYFGYEEEPFFTKDTNTIHIPYSFIQNIKKRFLKENLKSNIKTATIDSLTHIIFHEIAHGIIAMYNIPIVGREEDAADSLASILLIEFFEDGQEIVLNAARLFNLESKTIKKLKKDDFWDEHSLDIQRYYNTMCLIYGSDSIKYLYIKEKLEYSKKKANSCIKIYKMQLTNWFKLLKNIIKN